MYTISKARRLGKCFLIIDNMFVVIGFYVVFPLISIYFVEQLGWGAFLVGFALGLRQFIQQGLGIFSGAFADKLGAKPMIVSGLFIRTLGFIIMSVANTPLLLCLACVLSALGGTLFDPPRTALVIKLVRPWELGRFYSVLMLEDSMCAIIGIVLGTWLLQYNFKLVCFTGAILFFIAGVFNAWRLPAYKISSSHASLLEGIKKVLNNQRFVIYVFTLTGYYILSAQVMLMLPIRIHEVSGQLSYIKWMYIIEAILSLLLIMPITWWSEKYFKLETRLMAGLITMIISLFPIGLVKNLHTLLILISLFYIGSIIAEPARETLGALLTDYKARSSYIGFSKLSLALGGTVGYSGSGWLYDIGKEQNFTQLPWIILSIIGLITLLGLYCQFKYYSFQSLLNNNHDKKRKL
ncbi:Multidrug resistance protein mdtH [Candidatus Blochmanniella chromaiodes str. 640]|uniref:Multidrug resistance protein MdtH n=1 Tax=Candidatus Blochmanniella chromaiodes str. 640 TaxID=1240471 RepID=A0ABN4AYX9_9ENTR|nr:multidrug efflux MFS transporter MdtH [Candidatus Blochmannia chromaiodes]AGC03733.1 Multidrug resistance protein mdtH [Candidatus Blochmannia chromaiodes str. 640]